MQTERWTSTWTRRSGFVRTRQRARFCVTVPDKDARPLRRALLGRLDRRIERIVSEPNREWGERGTSTALHIVLALDAVDEAMHIVLSTASSAQLGRVRRMA